MQPAMQAAGGWVVGFHRWVSGWVGSAGGGQRGCRGPRRAATPCRGRGRWIGVRAVHGCISPCVNPSPESSDFRRNIMSVPQAAFDASSRPQCMVVL